MKIERINENTLKFYISYLDIEDLGFDREEIWYNRDRSEELFWQMMDEAHSQESFSLEGPLWIQVQALEKGMEIIVTRAQISKDGANLQLPISENKHLDIPINDREDQDSDQSNMSEAEAMKDGEDQDDEAEEDSQPISFIIEFDDLENLVSLSHAFEPHEDMDTALYVYKNHYYLNITFTDELSDDCQDDDLSKMLEFGLDTSMTQYVLMEYGKELIKDHALQTIKSHFPLLS
ncbi:adaptor protein MecA [Sporolactobacillus shoreicorticis]|uniref:Adapter protein MecA n=1 Tax=Sporolactobacillus shoreicorticis TaxID=1923877 RepID=A0ABW5S6D0_9BACL|nr:adaptor protein MecA [Sporolactobacillus shoreicorticis]MCO7126661.1 adaptor protein MecA [Sporolactobacillus shoreicorticis]